MHLAVLREERPHDVIPLAVTFPLRSPRQQLAASDLSCVSSNRINREACPPLPINNNNNNNMFPQDAAPSASLPPPVVCFSILTRRVVMFHDLHSLLSPGVGVAAELERASGPKARRPARASGARRAGALPEEELLYRASGWRSQLSCSAHRRVFMFTRLLIQR